MVYEENVGDAPERQADYYQPKYQGGEVGGGTTSTSELEKSVDAHTGKEETEDKKDRKKSSSREFVWPPAFQG